MKCDFAMRPAHGIVAPRAFGFDARWTVKDRHTRLPTEQEVAEINAKHLIRTPIKPADLLFVFGTREDVARRVDEAFRLWREGLFRWSIVSGGVTPGGSGTSLTNMAKASSRPAGVVITPAIALQELGQPSAPVGQELAHSGDRPTAVRIIADVAGTARDGHAAPSPPRRSCRPRASRGRGSR